MHQFQAKLHVTNICTDHSLNRLKTDWICFSLLCTGPSRSMMQAENKDKLWKFLFLKLILLITLSTAVSNTGNITFEIKPWEINNVFTFKNVVHTQNIRKIKVTTFSHQVDSPFYFWTDVCSAKQRKGMVMHDTEHPYWNQVSLNNTTFHNYRISPFEHHLWNEPGSNVIVAFHICTKKWTSNERWGAEDFEINACPALIQGW